MLSPECGRLSTLTIKMHDTIVKLHHKEQSPNRTRRNGRIHGICHSGELSHPFGETYALSIVVALTVNQSSP